MTDHPTAERRTPAELIREWRNEADVSAGYLLPACDCPAQMTRMAALKNCADELESALRQAEPPTGETPPAAFIADAVGVLVTWRNRLRADQAMRYTTSDDDKALTAALTVAIDALARPSDAGDPA